MLWFFFVLLFFSFWFARVYFVDLSISQSLSTTVATLEVKVNEHNDHRLGCVDSIELSSVISECPAQSYRSEPFHPHADLPPPRWVLIDKHAQRGVPIPVMSRRRKCVRILPPATSRSSSRTSLRTLRQSWKVTKGNFWPKEPAETPSSDRDHNRATQKKTPQTCFRRRNSNR